MEQIISRLHLLSGADLVMTPVVSVKHPTVKDVLSINGGLLCEDYYWAYVSALLCDPYDHMVYLDDMGKDYEKVTPFQVFCYRWIDMQKAVITHQDGAEDRLRLVYAALKMFFGQHVFDIGQLKGETVLLDKRDSMWFMTDEMFSLATAFITQINCIAREDKIKPATPSAKMVLIDDMRSELKKKARNKKEPERPDHIGDALAVVLAGGSGAINPSNYHDVHIYQLLSSSRAIQKQMVVQSMLNGIYTGMMKADKISNEDLRWV